MRFTCAIWESVVYCSIIERERLTSNYRKLLNNLKFKEMSTTNIFSQRIRIDRHETQIPADLVSSSLKSYEIFKAIFAHDKSDLDAFECFYALYLNQNNKVIAVQLISEGAVNQTCVPIAKVAQGALMAHAVSVVLCHNHPSGNLRPSQADIEITQKVKKGLYLLDILVLDHLIISSNGYYSFADEGII